MIGEKRELTPEEVEKLRKAALGLEGALHQISSHSEQFKNMGEMSDYARKAIDWADLECFDNGLFANPGKLTDLKIPKLTIPLKRGV